MRTKSFAIASLFLVAMMVLTSCGGAATPQVVERTVVVQQTAAPAAEKTVVVTSAPQVVTPTPAPAKAFTSKDPTSFVAAEFGEAETLDTALDYETAGGELVMALYDRLIDYNGVNPSDFVPSLATKWTISPDGKTYVFNIRSGVKFHDGTVMTPTDVAYTFQRGLLQGSTVSPQWLLSEPLLGAGKIDIADLVDSALEDTPDKLKAADPAKLKAACDAVTKAVVADDAAGTVTFNLAQPWGPFLATLANQWGSINSKKWVQANKGWDANCANWQNFYGITSENDPLTSIENGTGPFKLDHWTKGQEVVLVANPDYWRTDPAFPGGPTGQAKFKRVTFKKVDEWGTRFAMLQAGDADAANVQADNYDQADTLVGEVCTYNDKSTNANKLDCKVTDPNKPLRRYVNLPAIHRTDVFLNFAINAEGNTFMGSGKLDGNGIPADFFNDINVRKGFEYCFDWDTYNKEVLKGEATQAPTLFLPGQPGYDANNAVYKFDKQKCTDAFKASTLKSPDGKSLWDVGFRMQVAYNTGNTVRRTVAEILSSDLNAVNPKFVIESVGLPWPAFLRAQRAKTLPLFISGWQEDIHDSHNWIVPYATAGGTYSGRQSLPKQYTDPWTKIATDAVQQTDFSKRDTLYKQFNQQFYDAASVILLSNPTDRYYEQRWNSGWYWNPIFPAGLPAPLYAMAKK
ncbi:MAG TPA: ABC transporter substrate-binding protein [Anaerolineae bacterium]